VASQFGQRGTPFTLAPIPRKMAIRTGACLDDYQVFARRAGHSNAALQEQADRLFLRKY
jgi:hypothetical protein